MPVPDRGSVWIADLGIAAKSRPCFVLSVPPSSQERLLVSLISWPSLRYCSCFRPPAGT
jgi:mRNA interferase MazF